MATRLDLALNLAKSSFAILKKHRSLAIFPFIDTVLTIAVIVFILRPIEKVEMLAVQSRLITTKQYIVFFIALLIFFFCLHMISTLSNGAMIARTIGYLKKNNQKLGFANFGRLIIWVVMMTTVGIVIKTCEGLLAKHKNNLISKKLLNGLPWLTATFFVIPVIAIKSFMPVNAIKASSELMSNKWGAVNRMRISLGLLPWLLKIIAIIPILAAIIIGGHLVFYIGVLISAILLFAIFIADTGTHCITVAALYLYAQNDPLVEKYYNTDFLKHAFYAVKAR